MTRAEFERGRRKLWPSFTWGELACSHCGTLAWTSSALLTLQAIRTRYGQPMRVSSGYRCPAHPTEAAKARPGAHAAETPGAFAVDVVVAGWAAEVLADAAKAVFAARGITTPRGVPRIGLGRRQHGPRRRRFVHIDHWPEGPRPIIWTYDAPQEAA